AAGPALFSPGAGWLRCEPPPPNTVGRAGQATASAPPYSIPLANTPGGTNSVTGFRTPGGPVPTAPSPAGNKVGLSKLKKTAPTGAAGAGGNRRHGTPPIVPVALGLLAAALSPPATTRAGARRWRWGRGRGGRSPGPGARP